MEPVPQRRPRSGGTCVQGLHLLIPVNILKDPGRNEEDHVEAAWVPSQERADTPITRQAEGILRRLGTGTIIKYLLLSQR